MSVLTVCMRAACDELRELLTVARLCSVMLARWVSLETEAARLPSIDTARSCSVRVLAASEESAEVARRRSPAAPLARLLSTVIARICSMEMLDAVLAKVWTMELTREVVSFSDPKRVLIWNEHLKLVKKDTVQNESFSESKKQ